MSAQRLNPKSTRRIARSTGLEVIRAWGNGSYIHRFVTADHTHGWWDVGTREWGLYANDTDWHYSSCEELFPGYKQESRYLQRQEERKRTADAVRQLTPEQWDDMQNAWYEQHGLTVPVRVDRERIPEDVWREAHNQALGAVAAAAAAAHGVDPQLAGVLQRDVEQTLLPPQDPWQPPEPVEAGPEEGKLFSIRVTGEAAGDYGVSELPHYWRVALYESGGRAIKGVEPTVDYHPGKEGEDHEDPHYWVSGRALPPKGEPYDEQG